MNRERKNIQDIQGSDQNGSSAGSPISDGPGFRQSAHSPSRHGGHRYVVPFEGTARERREKRCIAKALAGVPCGTSVLNWPCEGGRLLPFLKKLGYSVTCADSSSHAVAQARFYGGFLGEGCIDDTDDFQVVDILQAGFDDDWFGAAVVNHLFYRFPESQIRQKVFKELGRICSGPIVVSFFRIVAVKKTVSYEHDKSCEYQMQNRIPISRRSFAREVSECGLIVAKWVPKHSVISKQACAVLVRNKGFCRAGSLFWCESHLQGDREPGR